MALGTITQLAVDPHSGSQVVPIAVGDVKLTLTTVVGDSAYATGGTALSPSQLGLSTVLFAVCTVAGSASNNGAVTAQYNLSTGKLQMFAGAGTTPNIGLAEPNSVNLSGLTVTVLAIGY